MHINNITISNTGDSMDKIILGLLLLQPRTIYQLRKRINDGLNLMYSCSTGSIQAAIKKLLKNGYIAVSEITEKGKNKKIYSITDNGSNFFNAWLKSPIDNGTAKNPELTKIYFLGFAEKETRIELIENHIKENTVFCAVMAANNETGVIQPVREIGAICRDRGVFFYSDCVQLAGAHKITADFCNGLAISAHKFYGPKGAGALVIKNGAKIAGLISGGMQERGLRGGTVNTANAVGLAKAYSIACKNAEKNSKNTAVLRDRLLTRILSEIPSAIRNGGGEILPAHLNVSFLGCRGENLLSALDLKGVAVSTGSACSAGAVNPSHVLTSMGLDAARVNSAVRFSFGKYNTLEQVDEAFEYLKQAVAKIRASK